MTKQRNKAKVYCTTCELIWIAVQDKEKDKCPRCQSIEFEVMNYSQKLHSQDYTDNQHSSEIFPGTISTTLK